MTSQEQKIEARIISYMQMLNGQATSDLLHARQLHVNNLSQAATLTRQEIEETQYVIAAMSRILIARNANQF